MTYQHHCSVLEGKNSVNQEWKGKYTDSENYINECEIDEPRSTKRDSLKFIINDKLYQKLRDLSILIKPSNTTKYVPLLSLSLLLSNKDNKDTYFAITK